MERKSLYELLYALNKEDDDRYNKLTNRGTVLISIISGFVALIGIVVTFFSKIIHPSQILSITIATGGVLLLLAMFLAILSLGIFTYKHICDIEMFVKDIESKEYGEKDVYSVLLANLAEASTHNRTVLDKRANYLKYSSIIICSTIVLFVLVIIYEIFSAIYTN